MRGSENQESTSGRGLGQMPVADSIDCLQVRLNNWHPCMFPEIIKHGMKSKQEGVTPRLNPHLRKLRPYPPGKPIEEVQREYGLDDVIKLASNENPFGPSPSAVGIMASSAAAGMPSKPRWVATGPSAMTPLQDIDLSWQWLIMGSPRSEL